MTLSPSAHEALAGLVDLRAGATTLLDWQRDYLAGHGFDVAQVDRVDELLAAGDALELEDVLEDAATLTLAQAPDYDDVPGRRQPKDDGRRHRTTDPACSQHRPPRTRVEWRAFDEARGRSCLVCMPPAPAGPGPVVP